MSETLTALPQLLLQYLPLFLVVLGLLVLYYWGGKRVETGKSFRIKSMADERDRGRTSFGLMIFWGGLGILLVLRLIPDLPVWIGYGFFALLVLVLVLDQVQFHINGP